MSSTLSRYPLNNSKMFGSYLLRLVTRRETGVEPELPLDPLTRAFAFFLA